MWQRVQGFGIPDRDRTVHVTLPDLTEILAFPGEGHRPSHPAAVEALVEWHNNTAELGSVENVQRDQVADRAEPLPWPTVPGYDR